MCAWPRPLRLESQTDQPGRRTAASAVTENPSGVRVTTQALRRRKSATAENRETTAQWHMALSPRLSMDLSLTRIHPRLGLSAQLSNPSQEQGGVKVIRAGRNGTLPPSLHLARQVRAWRTATPRSARTRMAPGQPPDAAHGHRHATADPERAPMLRMAGMKDRAGISMRYQISRLDQITMEHWRDKLQTADRWCTGHGSPFPR